MADFDPDTYLAQKQAGAPQAPGGFDPDQYLAAKTSSAPAAAAAPKDEGSLDPGQRSALLDMYRAGNPVEKAELIAHVLAAEAVSKAKSAGQTVLDMGGPAIGATLGGIAGEAGGPLAPVTAPLGRAAGGALGDFVAQESRIHQGKQEGLKYGELAGTALASAIPGANLAETGGASIAKQALAQGAGGLAAKTIQTEADEGRLPTAGEAAISTLLPAAAGAAGQKMQLANPEIQDAAAAATAKVAQKRAVLAAGQKAGLVVEPAAVNPTITNKFIESLAGSPSIRQAATHINASKFDDLARAVLDPDNPNIELTAEAARAVRANAYKEGYEPIANLGKIPTDQAYHDQLAAITSNRTAASNSFPGISDDSVEKTVAPLMVPSFDAGDALKATQVLRDKANTAFAAGNNDLGRAARQASNAIEGQIERHLSIKSGETVPPLPDTLNEAQAKTFGEIPEKWTDLPAEGGSDVKIMRSGDKVVVQATGNVGNYKNLGESTFHIGDDGKLVASQRGDSQLSGAAQTAFQRALSKTAPGTPDAAEAAKAAGMLSDFRDARTLMAQSHDVEDAIREGSGRIIPSVLASKVQAQKPLSGNLKTIGEFANTFPQVSREAGKTPVPGATVTGNFARATLGGVGALAGGALGGHEGAEMGALAGVAIPSIRGAVRTLVLSPAYQRLMAKIPAKVEAGSDKSGLFLRELGQAAGQQPGEESK